eukprot:comp9180_c0_seq1/m.4329 comp9180_c0_seq1/g.4329  ORF comp9180_c0_seq1/g.4329 comp9180_c0_seq1/m.4329 type:complete len:104 (-) comp9180_c0_seq1:484-795(-)
MISSYACQTTARLCRRHTVETIARRPLSFSIFKRLTGKDVVQDSEAAFKATAPARTQVKVEAKAPTKPAPVERDGLKMRPAPTPSYMKSEYFAKEQSLFGHDF